MAARLHVVSKAETQFLDDVVFAAEWANGKKLYVLKKVWLLNLPGASLSLFVVNR